MKLIGLNGLVVGRKEFNGESWEHGDVKHPSLHLPITQSNFPRKKAFVVVHLLMDNKAPALLMAYWLHIKTNFYCECLLRIKD